MNSKTFLSLSLLLLCVVRFGAQAPTTVEGVVVNVLTGTPVPNAAVTLTPETRSLFSFGAAQGRSVATDDTGKFIFTNVTPGRYLVTPSQNGFVFAQSERVKNLRAPGIWVQVHAGEHLQDLKLELTKEGVISGRILDTNLNPAIANITVSLRRHTFTETGERDLEVAPGIQRAGSPTKPDDRGDFRIYGVPPGDYIVGVSGIGGWVYYPSTTDPEQAEPVHVKAGEEFKLSPIIFRPPDQKRTSVRLKYTGVTIQNPPTIYYGGGALFSGTPLTPDQVQTISLPQGQFDLFISGASAFGRTHVDVGATELEQEVFLSRGVTTRVRVFREDAPGSRSALTAPGSELGCSVQLQGAPATFNCNMRGNTIFLGGGFAFGNTETPAVPPGDYLLSFSKLPVDAFVAAVEIGGRDVSNQAFKIDGETQIDIVLGAGNVVTGSVLDATGEKLPSAIVAIVPDNASAESWHLYRSGITDSKGAFELSGVAPGSYQVFAWPDLTGAAFRNAEFMKKYEGKGQAIKVEKASRVSVDVTALD